MSPAAPVEIAGTAQQSLLTSIAILSDSQNLCPQCPHPTESTIPEICRNFQRGRCTRGPQCNRQHIHGKITSNGSPNPVRAIRTPIPVTPSAISLASSSGASSVTVTVTSSRSTPLSISELSETTSQPAQTCGPQEPSGSRNPPSHSAQEIPTDSSIPPQNPETQRNPSSTPSAKSTRNSRRRGQQKQKQPATQAPTKSSGPPEPSVPAPSPQTSQKTVCVDHQQGACKNQHCGFAHVTSEVPLAPTTPNLSREIKPSVLPDPRGVKVTSPQALAAYMVKLPNASTRSSEGLTVSDGNVGNVSSSETSTSKPNTTPLRPSSPSSFPGKLFDGPDQVSDLSSSVSTSAYSTALSRFEADSESLDESSISSDAGNLTQPCSLSLPAQSKNTKATLPDFICRRDALYHSCNRGSSCSFVHIRPELLPIILNRSLEIQDQLRNEPCIEYLLGRCKWGPKCFRPHVNAPTVFIKKPNELCFVWMTGKCRNGEKCRYDHERVTFRERFFSHGKFQPTGTSTLHSSSGGSQDINTPADKMEGSSGGGDVINLSTLYPSKTDNNVAIRLNQKVDSTPSVSPPQEPYQLQQNSILKQILLELNKAPEPPPQYPPGLPPVPVKESPRPSKAISTVSDPDASDLNQEKQHWTFKVATHMKVRLSSGFHVESITTGFDTCKTIVTNTPLKANAEKIRQLGSKFGSILDVVPLARGGGYCLTYSSPEEALRAAAGINGTQLMSNSLVSHIALGNRTTEYKTRVSDIMVRIDWEVPHRTAYVGFDDLETAKRALRDLHNLEVSGTVISATWYHGLPAVRNHNLQVAFLPPDANTKVLNHILGPFHADEIMWNPPNYEASLQATKQYIQTLLTESGDLNGFEVQQPSHHGWARGWAWFSTAAAAQRATRQIGTRRPIFMNKARVVAHRIHTIDYSLRDVVFEEAAADVELLRKQAWENGLRHQLSLSVLPPSPSRDGQMRFRRVRLSATDKRELMKLKSNFEIAIYGEVLRDEDGKIIWENYFRYERAAAFCDQLQRRHPGVRININKVRQVIRIFGPLNQRANVKSALLEKASEFRHDFIRSIPIKGHAITFFLQHELPQLLRSAGPERVTLLLYEQVVSVRGDLELYDKAVTAVRRAEQQDTNRDIPADKQCTVCFDRAVRPYELKCGHLYCAACLGKYILSSPGNKAFPVRCLGNDANCAELIPLRAARQVLDPNEFESVVRGAFHSFVHARPKEFHFCPTPDCEQVYRHGPQDTFIQCPSCTVRICPACHVEYHEGVLCKDYDEVGDKAFAAWAKEHGVKNCPGCKAPIEKVEGCNHMTCTRCQTHICWVCLETFPHGEGIYVHLRAKHGGFGIVDGLD